MIEIINTQVDGIAVITFLVWVLLTQIITHFLFEEHKEK